MINHDGDLSFVPIEKYHKVHIEYKHENKNQGRSIEVHTGLHSFFASKSEISIFRSLFSRATEISRTRTNLFSPMTSSPNLT